MTDSLPGRKTPDGSSDSLYVTPSMTSVWPALWPPWKRTTISACSDSQSTIFPLPSSPHWEPTTTTLAMQCLSPWRHENLANQQRLVQAQAHPGIKDRAPPGKAVHTRTQADPLGGGRL